MNKHQAEKLIKELFANEFDIDRYQYFLRNLFNKYVKRHKHYIGAYIPDAFKLHIHQYWRIGKYVDPLGDELDLLVVEVKSLSKLNRARSALRNFAVNRLKTFNKHSSLVVFYSQEDGGADWRFSFIKIEEEAFQDVDGKIKLKQELTPARRASFLVGLHENSYTAAKQLVPLLEKESGKPLIEDIEEAFSVEQVSQEFFDQYRTLFQLLAAHLKTEKVFQTNTEEETDQLVTRFAKKLLGQIVFLYFL